MTSQEVIDQLADLGNENTKKILVRHGAKEPFFGVKIGDLKPLQKTLKKNHELALDLYDSGNSDAMYLAGLIADEKQMSKRDLQKWVKGAYWYMLSEYTVAQVAAESDHGWELALEWIESPKEMIAAAGWSTLGNLVSIKPDEDLDIPALKALLARAAKEVHSAQNRVRYTMNGFIIAAGSFVPALTDKAANLARKVGKVDVDVGGTSCKVPEAAGVIAKIKDMGRIGKKRKMARC